MFLFNLTISMLKRLFILNIYTFFAFLSSSLPSSSFYFVSYGIRNLFLFNSYQIIHIFYPLSHRLHVLLWLSRYLCERKLKIFKLPWEIFYANFSSIFLASMFISFYRVDKELEAVSCKSWSNE